MRRFSKYLGGPVLKVRIPNHPKSIYGSWLNHFGSTRLQATLGNILIGKNKKVWRHGQTWRRMMTVTALSSPSIAARKSSPFHRFIISPNLHHYAAVNKWGIWDKTSYGVMRKGSKTAHRTNIWNFHCLHRFCGADFGSAEPQIFLSAGSSSGPVNIFIRYLDDCLVWQLRYLFDLSTVLVLFYMNWWMLYLSK